jgi:hypothetical protein
MRKLESRWQERGHRADQGLAGEGRLDLQALTAIREVFFTQGHSDGVDSRKLSLSQLMGKLFWRIQRILIELGVVDVDDYAQSNFPGFPFRSPPQNTLHALGLGCHATHRKPPHICFARVSVCSVSVLHERKTLGG